MTGVGFLNDAFFYENFRKENPTPFRSMLNDLVKQILDFKSMDERGLALISALVCFVLQGKIRFAPMSEQFFLEDFSKRIELGEVFESLVQKH